MPDIKTTTTQKKLIVDLDITDQKYVRYTLKDPSQDVDFEAVSTFVTAAVQGQVVMVDGLPATGLKQAYIETTTKEYLENT